MFCERAVDFTTERECRFFDVESIDAVLENDQNCRAEQYVVMKTSTHGAFRGPNVFVFAGAPYISVKNSNAY